MIELDTVFYLIHKEDERPEKLEEALFSVKHTGEYTAEVLSALLAHAMQSEDNPVPAWMVCRAGVAIKNMGDLAHQAEIQQRQAAEDRVQQRQES